MPEALIVQKSVSILQVSYWHQNVSSYTMSTSQGLSDAVDSARPIHVLEHEPILLSDGVTLSAMVWKPLDAVKEPVPAILEYLPYRKRDMTARRDALNHPYFAAHGYACVRVDMRGAGESEGKLQGEYLQQEQDDALEILRWISAQPWCTGSIGMIGISWGGFNSLQVAALRPPELKAIVSICSSDDRYSDDIHYMGGCQLVDNFLWGAFMFSHSVAPPDPALVGERWRDLWMARLEAGVLYMDDWHSHQRRDGFWKHASISEDYRAVQCPVYVVGGWTDPYTNTVFRMMDKLECPKKGLVGPWGHLYPNFAQPGPQIGFLQECLRWWDKWLKNKETGIMEEPALRCYLQDTVPPSPHYNFRPGHWVAEESWPSERITTRALGFAADQLTEKVALSDEKISFCSPQTVGIVAGRWLPFGVTADGPGDQRLDAGSSLLFDSQTLSEPLDILGAPVAQLRISSDKANALIATVLSEVLQDGSVTRLSYGFLNLTHRSSHVDLQALEPGQYYDVAVKLNYCGQRVSAGSRIRLALSTSYFPIVWPSPANATLTIDCAHSRLDLPTRPETPEDAKLKPLGPAVNAPPLPTKELRKANANYTATRDISTGELVYCFDNDSGAFENENTGWRFGTRETVTCAIRPDDPLSARSEHRLRREFGREGMDVAIDGQCRMTVTETEFHITARLEAWEHGDKVFARDHAFSVARDHA